MTKDNITKAIVGIIIGATIGWFIVAPITTPINVISPPAETIQIPPDPIFRDPAPEHYVNATTVLDLVDVLADIHKEAKATKAELEAVKREAQQIIQAMVMEIQRLQARPTVTPTEPTPADGPTFDL